MNLLTKIGYAIIVSLCFALPHGAKAQELPAIDLPPLPGVDDAEAGMPDLPPLPGEEIAEQTPQVPVASEDDLAVTLPPIEVSGGAVPPSIDVDLPPLPEGSEETAQNEMDEMPALPALGDEADAPVDAPVAAPVVLADEEEPLTAPLPPLGSDDPFADPFFETAEEETPAQEEEKSVELISSDLPDNAGPVLLEPLLDTEVVVEEDTKEAPKTHKSARKQAPFNYKVVRMPAPLAVREQTKNNRHLPVARYESDMDHSVYVAAAHDDVNGLRALLNNGRRLDMKNQMGDTPLITAIRANSMKTARLLVARGARVDVRNKYGMTAMDVARQQRNQAALALLSPLVFAQNQ